MRKFALAFSALCLSATVGTAADDPIAARKALMQANAASAGLAAAMMKEEMEYSPAVAKSVILTLRATAMTAGDFFPEGTGNGQTDAETRASPNIWEDAAGFQETLGKFQTDTEAAVEASGEDGPVDLAAFQAAIGPVLENCRSCHEDFRVQDN